MTEINDIIRQHTATAVKMADVYFLENLATPLDFDAERFTKDMEDVAAGMFGAIAQLMLEKGLGQYLAVVEEAIVEAFFARWHELLASSSQFGGRA